MEHKHVIEGDANVGKKINGKRSLSTKQKAFIKDLNKHLYPIAKVIQISHETHIMFQFVGAGTNNFIGGMMFELSDQFYNMVDKLALKYFSKVSDEVIRLDATNQVFLFTC